MLGHGGIVIGEAPGEDDTPSEALPAAAKRWYRGALPRFGPTGRRLLPRLQLRCVNDEWRTRISCNTDFVSVGAGIGREELRRPVELPVHIRIAQNRLHVFAGFGEGDGLDELLRIAIVPLSQPVSDAVGAGIVGGQGVLELS